MTHIFIINPFAGSKYFAADLRSKLENITDFQFFVFNTRHAGYEREVIKRIRKLFQDEKLRFYCCGGSGTFRNMLNGFDDFDNVEVTFVPFGLSNDFLKVFGDEESRFQNIEELVNGEVKYLDYIRTNNGVAINTCSLGLDLEVCAKNINYRVFTPFSSQIPYTMSLFHGLLFTKDFEYEVRINDEHFWQKSTEMVFCNGNTLGGDLRFVEDADVTDGVAGFYMCDSLRLSKRMGLMMALASRNYDKVNRVMHKREASPVKIRRKDGRPFAMNMDGEIAGEAEEWNIEIVKKGLPFVVPKGMKIYHDNE